MNIKPLYCVLKQMKKTLFTQQYHFFFVITIILIVTIYIKGLYGMIHQTSSAPF